MGVNTGWPTIHKAQGRLSKDRRRYPKATYPDIRSSHSTMAVAIQAFRTSGAVPTGPLFIAIDVYAHFGHLLYKLAGQCCLDSFYQQLYDSHASVAARASAIYKRQFKEALLDFDRELKAATQLQDSIVYCLDNKVLLGAAKLPEFIKRQQKRNQDLARYTTALDELITIRGLSRSARRKRNKVNRARHLRKVILKTGWAALDSSFSSVEILTDALGLPAVVASQEHAGFDLANHKEQVMQAWTATNGAITQGGRQQMIACADEADMSIYRICAHFSGQNYRTLVFSQDSDFNFIPSYLDVAGTIRFDKWMRVKRKESNKPWTLVNNASLHQYAPVWTWDTDYGRLAAVMMAGHDYVPGGIRNVGLSKLSTAACLMGVNDFEALLVALANHGGSKPDTHWSNSALEALIDADSDLPVTFFDAIAVCERYAHRETRIRSEINIPPPQANGQQEVDIDLSDRTTFRFPHRRAAPKVERLQNFETEKVFHARSGRRPARQANALINPEALGHRPFPDLHLVREEAHRYSVTPPEQLALYDPNIDLDDEPEQVERARFMIAEGKTEPPTWARKAAGDRERSRAEWEDGVAPQGRQTARGHDEEAEEEEEEDRSDPTAASTKGAWDIVTLPLVLSSALNFFHPSEAGVRNPLYHLFLLLPAFWIEYTNVIMDVFNIYTRILTTDQRLLEVWRYRSRRNKTEWITVIRELVTLLSIPTADFPNVDQRATEAEYLPKWSHYGESEVDDVQIENIPFRANLKSYCDEFGVFGYEGAALLREGRVAENLDPALVFAVIKYRRAQVPGFAHAPLLVKGLTDLSTWQGGIQNIWNSLTKKLASANLRSGFEEEVKARTKIAAEGQRIPRDMQNSIIDQIFSISHRDTGSPASIQRWIDQLLETAGCQDGFLDKLRPWLQEVAIAFHTRCTRSSHFSTLDQRLRTEDPHIRVLENVPFFAYLGMDLSLDRSARFMPANAVLVRDALVKVRKLVPGILDWFQSRFGGQAGLGAHGGVFHKLHQLHFLHRDPNGVYAASPERLRTLADRCSYIVKQAGGNSRIQSERHNLFALLFSSEKLPFMHVWNCSLNTDGYSLRLQMFDIRKPIIKGAFANYLIRREHFILNAEDKQVWRAAEQLATPLDVFEAFCRWQKTWGDEQKIDVDLGVRYYHPRAFPSRKNSKKHRARKIAKTRVENVFHRLRRQQLHEVGKKGKLYPPGTDPTAVPPAPPPTQPIQLRALLQPYFEAPNRKTKDALALGTVRLSTSTRASVLQQMKALLIARNEDGAQQVAGMSEQQVVETFVTCGFDPGEYNPFVAAIISRWDSRNRRSESLVMTHHEVEASRKQAQRKTAAIRNAHFAGLAADAVKAEADYNNGRARGKVAFDSLVKRDSLKKRLAQQTIEAIWPENFDQGRRLAHPSEIRQPALFAVGDGCEMSKHGKGVKHVDASMSLLRAVIHHIERQGYPLLVVWVGESYSSQCCPDPTCLRPPGDVWRPALAEWKAQKEVEPELPIPANWVRSAVMKGNFGGTTDLNQRLLHCQTCHKLFNRDVSAALNIAQIAEHIIVHGRHPWRPRRND